MQIKQKPRRIGVNRAQHLSTKKNRRKELFQGALNKTVKPFVLLLSLSFFAGGLGYAGHVVLNKMQKSQAFRIKQVSVKGSHHLEPSAILQAIQLEPTRSIAGVFEKEIWKKTRSLEWIKKISLHRHFDRSLEIQVEEYEPIAWVRLDSTYLITQEGRLLRPLAGAFFDLPVISGITDAPDSTKTLLASPQWNRAKTALLSLKNSNPKLFLSLSEIMVNQNSTILYTIAGTCLLLPVEISSSCMDKMASLWDRLVKEGRTPKEINLKYEHVAYVR